MLLPPGRSTLEQTITVQQPSLPHETLLGREKHFTGILIYKTVIIKIKPRTCDNKTTSKTYVDMTLTPTLPHPKHKKKEEKKKRKVIHLKHSFRHISLYGSHLSGGQECFSQNNTKNKE